MGGGNITELPEYTGYIGAGVAVLFFGSNYVPVKQVDTGDGLMFQFFFSLAAWIPSVVLHAIRGFPRFWPLAMFGGVLWCTGNALTVTIIQCIGMAMGILVWAMVNMVVGWASGSFGWFGTTAQPANNMLLNCIGVGLCVFGAVVVFFIKPTLRQPRDQDSNETKNHDEKSHLITSTPDPNHFHSPPDINSKDYGSVDKSVGKAPAVKTGDTHSLANKLSPKQRKIVGISMAAITGTFWAFNFTPILYIKDNYGENGSDYKSCTVEPCYSDVSQKDIDYVFPHFTGLLLTSTFYFVVYCFYMKNRPRIYPRAILPALLSGAMWSIGDIGWFLANETLDESVSFPIICAGPPILGSLWGLLVFKEIQGKKNILLLSIAFCFVIGGSVLTAVSKD